MFTQINNIIFLAGTGQQFALATKTWHFHFANVTFGPPSFWATFPFQAHNRSLQEKKRTVSIIT